ncbi:MAG TPA: FkbM family methyltransferase [Bryobacteraceae bacterium]|nr:FkbM family methyltransferase [Bryobacteraceae bacterium]
MPHLGWLVHEPGDLVAVYLNQGWFEYKEQAFAWLYLRDGDTVVDCGAHFGLYAVLAARAAAGCAVLAVEANPSTIPVLQQNLDALGLPGARVVAKALSAKSGEISFFPASPGRAAYSSLIPDPDAAAAVTVPAIALDDLLDETGLVRVDFLKIDVEGAEIDVLEGAARSLAGDRLPLAMVEFTEQNLARSGRGTKDLFDWIEAHGGQVCRFDPDRLQLVPCSFEEPVWYENLFLTRDPDPVNRRLAGAPPARLRIARELLERGRAASDLYQRAEDAAQVVAIAKQNVEEAYQRLAEANHRTEEARNETASVQCLLGIERARLEELKQHLRPYLVSRYLRLGSKLKIIHEPVWLARFAAEKPEDGSGR